MGYISPSVVSKNSNFVKKFKIFFTTTYSTNATIPPKEIVASPNVICTETFLVIGPFDSEEEALRCQKYISTDFFRMLLYMGHGFMQVSPDTFRYIPLPDFKNSEQISWDSSIEDIERQLYKFYNLNDDEINFIKSTIIT